MQREMVSRSKGYKERQTQKKRRSGLRRGRRRNAVGCRVMVARTRVASQGKERK